MILPKNLIESHSINEIYQNNHIVCYVQFFQLKIEDKGSTIKDTDSWVNVINAKTARGTKRISKFNNFQRSWKKAHGL